MVPAVPSFAVDQGFWYSNDDSQIGLGSLVRVPLGGRRVRGYVVEVGERPPGRAGNLRPVGPLVMTLPLFDGPLYQALLWAAHHYVAPLAVLLERTAPPNLANRLLETAPGSTHTGVSGALTELAEALVTGRRRPVTAYLAPSAQSDWINQLAAPILGEGRSMMVVTATGAEVRDLAQTVAPALADRLTVVGPDASGAETTAAWVAGQSGGRLVIGTPRISTWRIPDLAAAVAVEEGRRAMKERQTPTLSVRDLLGTRARLSGFGQVVVGPTPSVETIAGGATVIRSNRRAWPPVEIVDRSTEISEGGFLGPTAIAAIRAVTSRKGNVFVFAHRRGFSPASRCRACGTVRTCSRCGAKAEPSLECRRCGANLGPCANCASTDFAPLGAGVGRIEEELRRRVGDGPHLRVGSESDLAGLELQDLTVAVDCDGLILGTHYRAAEEALRILARLAGKVGGKGSRSLLQTSQPEHPVIVALRRGDPISFLEAEVVERQRMNFPPASQLLVIETRGPSPDPDQLAQATEGATLLGPALRTSSTGEPAQRWLLQAKDLGPVRLRLRPLVQSWRDSGNVVRVDADPIDL